MPKLSLASLAEDASAHARITAPDAASTAGNAIKIVGVSDVSVGYGSPQIPRLMGSLADYYGSTALILEPDQSDKQPLKTPPHRCHLERVRTAAHPHTELGRRQFVAAATRRLNALRPDVLVLFCTYTLPVLTGLRRKPRFTLYHSLESILSYGPLDVRLNGHLADQIDVVIFPEENRARLDGQRCGLLRRPMVVMYNVRNERRFNPSPLARRTAKLLYSGTLDRDQTLAEYFLRPELAGLPIDIYGQTTGSDSDALKATLSAANGAVHYHGYVPAATLDGVRGQYGFSIVLWAPNNENQYYAAPNKFFDAIADGIPPIVAPHPQCKQFVDRYGCGIVMDDWGFPAFLAAVKRARSLFGTSEYDRLVAGCGRAVEREVNWPAQFEKLVPLLRSQSAHRSAA